MDPLQLFCFWLQTRERQIYAQTRAAFSNLGQGQGWKRPALFPLAALSAPSQGLWPLTSHLRSGPRGSWWRGRACGPRKSEGLVCTATQPLASSRVTWARAPPPSNGPGHRLKVALASSRRQVALLHLPSTGSPGSCLQLRGADPALFQPQLLKRECPPCIPTRTPG